MAAMREERPWLASDGEHERMRTALTVAREWFLRPENVDLSGSDRVYRLIDEALGTEYAPRSPARSPR